MIKTVNLGKEWFGTKQETIGSITDFLTESPIKKKEKDLLGSFFLTGVGVGLVNLLNVKQTMVADVVPVLAMPMPILGVSGIAGKIISAFEPVIQIIQGLSYPVGFIMLTAGFLVIMTGNRQKGLNMIKWATIGYIGMQFAPGIMAILVEVGKAMGR